jgi:hypothetical protein
VDLPPGVEEVDAPPGISQLPSGISRMDFSQPPPTRYVIHFFLIICLPIYPPVVVVEFLEGK